MRELQIRPGTGTSNRGGERVLQILEAAKVILIRDGYRRLSLRAIAAESKISVGNLTYYYRHKADLLRDLVRHVFDGYETEFTRIRKAHTGDAREAFEAVLRFIFRDLGTRETTVFFPELWALANHEAYAARVLNELYTAERRIFKELIEQINPRLDAGTVELLALNISASIEGHTMFVGANKPWARRRRKLEDLLVRNALSMVLDDRS